jgi:hypothetical protein
MINKKHIGQVFEGFLQEEGMYEQVQLNAEKDPCPPNQGHDAGTRHAQNRDGKSYEHEPILSGPSAK